MWNKIIIILLFVGARIWCIALQTMISSVPHNVHQSKKTLSVSPVEWSCAFIGAQLSACGQWFIEWLNFCWAMKIDWMRFLRLSLSFSPLSLSFSLLFACSVYLIAIFNEFYSKPQKETRAESNFIRFSINRKSIFNWHYKFNAFLHRYLY